jgi:hypothetical protein
MGMSGMSDYQFQQEMLAMLAMIADTLEEIKQLMVESDDESGTDAQSLGSETDSGLGETSQN